MKTLEGKFFETRVTSLKTFEDGLVKKVKETFAVRAESFAECEQRITETLKDYQYEDFAVLRETICPYQVILLSDKDCDYFRVKFGIIMLDENSGKEKTIFRYVLVAANTLEQARQMVDEFVSHTGMDFTIDAVVKSPVVNII